MPVVPPTAGLPLRRGDLRPWNLPPPVAFEEALAQWLGLPAVQLTCSGTAALVIALSALRDRAMATRDVSRDEVVVPAYTCPLVALAVTHCGLRLRVCELLPDSLDMDPAVLAALCGPRTLAVLPTHLGGRVADVAAARACAAAVGAAVIEDAAQALGARVDGRSVGADSEVAFFSLAVGKGLTTYEGGVLVVRDPALREHCRRVAADLAPARLGWELWRSAQLVGCAALYGPRGLEWAYRRPLERALAEDDWLAAAGDDFGDRVPLHTLGRWRRAVGLRALPRLAGFLDDGRRRAAVRAERLARLPGLRVLRDSAAQPGADGTWPVLLALLPERAARDRVLERHWADGSGLSVPFVRVLTDYPAAERAMAGAPMPALPAARSLANRLLTVSNSPWLDDARFEALCRNLEAAVVGGAGRPAGRGLAPA